MDITITCKSYEELVQFAGMLLNAAGTVGQASSVNKDTPAVSAMPASPVMPELSSEATVPTVAPAQTVPLAPSVTPAAPVAPSPGQNIAVPTSKATYTLDDLARAAVTLMDSGRQTDLQQLLQSFGVASLPELSTARYGEFATALRTMGAPI